MTEAEETTPDLVSDSDWQTHFDKLVTGAFDHEQLVVGLSQDERNKIQAAIDEVGVPDGTKFLAKRGVRDNKGSVAILIWTPPMADGNRISSFPIGLWDDRIDAATEGAQAVREAYERATGA